MVWKVAPGGAKKKLLLTSGLLGAAWGRQEVGNRWKTTARSVFDNIMDRKHRITRPGSDTRAQEPPSVPEAFLEIHKFHCLFENNSISRKSIILGPGPRPLGSGP